MQLFIVQFFLTIQLFPFCLPLLSFRSCSYLIIWFGIIAVISRNRYL